MRPYLIKRMTLYIALLACAALSISGCDRSGEETDMPADIYLPGSWHLVSWNGSGTGDIFDIYVSFGTDGKFTMYQKLYTLEYERYDGTYEIDGNSISGTYSDGERWGSSYAAEFSEDGNTVTLTSKDYGEDEASYIREEIPESIINGTVPDSRSKGGHASGRRWL